MMEHKGMSEGVKKVIRTQFRLKLRIIEGIKNYKKGFGSVNISEISRVTKMSYKETYRQVKWLSKQNFVTCTRFNNQKHRPVLIKLTKYGIEFWELLK